MANLTSDTFVAYLRGYTRGITKAVVSEGDFGTRRGTGANEFDFFETVEQYVAFALGLRQGAVGNDPLSRSQVDLRVKGLLGQPQT